MSSASAVQIFQTLASALLVIAMMAGLGLRLRPAEMLGLLRRPLLLVVTVIVNIVVVPGLTWLLARGLGLGPEITLGLILCAAAPGGPVAALYTNTARTDPALAGGMVIALPAIGLLTTPVTITLLTELPGADTTIPVLPMLATLIVFQALPFALAMRVRERRPALAERAAPILGHIANVILGAFIVGMLAFKHEVMFGISGPTWLALVGATLGALVVGYLAALPRPDEARSGSLIAASRNIGVGIMLSSTFVGSTIVDATVLTYGLVAFVIPLALSLWWRRRTLA